MAIQYHCRTFWYNVDTVFYQFLQTGTSIRIHIGRDQLLKCLGFSLHPLSFFLNNSIKSSAFLVENPYNLFIQRTRTSKDWNYKRSRYYLLKLKCPDLPEEFKKIHFFTNLPLGYPWVPSKNVSLFGLAIWPAITNICIFLHFFLQFY